MNTLPQPPYGLGPQAPSPSQLPPAGGYGYAPPSSGFAPRMARPEVSLSTAAYLVLLVGANQLGLYATSFAQSKFLDGGTQALALGLGVVLSLVNAVAFCVLVHKMWSAVQDGQEPTTPGRAVGLLFVPFYNLYWVFRALPGWASAYNAFAARQGLRTRAAMAPLLAAVLVTPIPMIQRGVSGLSHGLDRTAYFGTGLVNSTLGVLHLVALTWMVIHVTDRVRALRD